MKGVSKFVWQGTYGVLFEELVSWCFEPLNHKRITSGLSCLKTVEKDSLHTKAATLSDPLLLSFFLSFFLFWVFWFCFLLRLCTLLNFRFCILYRFRGVHLKDVLCIS